MRSCCKSFMAASVLIMSALPGSAKPNHLIKEKSPYLLQHAYNPVDWRPWGEEAFAKARAEDKPIILSIGYSTCHWCHVMEHESFENERIAAQMNKDFVCIKVDREERPDVDKIYMTAVQAMTGSGGWPLNVFLTPELKPFFGGTYFPPESRWGQPAWPQLLARIAELWRTRREDLIKDSGKMAEAIKDSVEVPASSATLVKPAPAWLDRAYAGYEGSFDDVHGGFGGAPKFPMPVNLDYLLRYHARTGNKKALEMSLFTLHAMANGGVYDQIGGGFHRYSTDGEWIVPHFEKMLYDNAQLASVYLDAYQATGDEDLARVARETLDYVLRDMTSAEGGFFSAEDADSLPSKDAKRKTEGAFYVWTEAELREVLGKDADAFIKRFGVRPEGNAPSDPHGEFAGKNILHGKGGFGPAASKALAARAKRPRPGLDDKVLTSWNGLMISALARGAQVLEEPRYLAAAQKAARSVRTRLYDSKTRALFHRWRDGERAIPGISDDYAFLVQGLLDLYEADFDPNHLDWAVGLTETQNKLFAGPDGGFYLTAEGSDKRLLARVMEDVDNVEPSASSVAALDLLRLSHLTDRKDFRETAVKTLSLFSSRMKERPMSLPKMLCAADLSLSKVKQIVIAGEDASAMLREVRKRFLPDKIVIHLSNASRPRLEKLLPFLKNVKPIGGKTAAYVCVDYSCRLPTTDIKTLAKLLDEKP